MKSHAKVYTTTIVINGQTVFKGRADEQERELLFELANELIQHRALAVAGGK